MEILYFEQLLNSGYEAQVYDLLCRSDGEFVPPLSQRTTTTQSDLTGDAPVSDACPMAYFQELEKQAILLVVDQGVVAGFMSYRPEYVCADLQDDVKTAYVSTVIVEPEFRGRSLTKAMYRELIRRAGGLPVSTRTWSTNHAHLVILSRMGFREVLRIEDGRGPGIDTVYFRLEALYHAEANEQAQ